MCRIKPGVAASFVYAFVEAKYQRRYDYQNVSAVRFYRSYSSLVSQKEMKEAQKDSNNTDR